jgi:ribosome-binding factor A
VVLKGFSRSDRLSSQIKRELSEIVLGMMELSAGLIITITEVELSKDLRLGKVYYSVLGGKDSKEKAELFFANHAKDIRMELGAKIRVRFIPELKYYFDNSIERGQRINELLDQIKNEERQD